MKKIWRYINSLIDGYNTWVQRDESGEWFTDEEKQQMNDLARNIEFWEETIGIQLNTINNLEREYKASKRRLEQTQKDIQDEIQETKAYVEGEIQDHNTFMTEQGERAEEIKAEAQRQVEEISNNINYYVEEEDRRLKAIVNQMESEYGGKYAEFGNLFPLLEQGNFDALSSALFSLRASGGNKTDEAHNIVASMQMAKGSMGVIVGQLNSKNSILKSMVDELDRLSSEIEVDEREIESLKEELEEYHQSSFQRIEELEEIIRQKKEAYEEGLTVSFIEILELHRSIIQNQVIIIAHILLLDTDIDEFLQSWAEEKAKLNEEYNQEPYSIISGLFEGEELPPQNITLSVTPYQLQDIQKSESLEGERKVNFVRAWYQLLRARDVFSEEKRVFSEIFEHSLDEVEDFLYILFVRGLSSSRVLAEEVRFVGEESSSENASIGYRVILRGETFWLDEAGNLKQAPDRDPLFQHVFSVPWDQDTELGREIRGFYKSFKEQFKGKLEVLGEKEKRAVVMAESLLRLAYQIRQETQEESRRFINLAQSLVYLALNVSPAGDAIDLYECVIGYDIFGNKLTGGERLLSGLSLFVGNRKLWASFKDKFHNIFDPSASRTFKKI